MSTPDQTSQRPTVTGRPWLAVAGRALGVVSAFLVTAVVARLLPEGSFGDFNMLLTILTPISWWAALGLNSSAVRLLGEEEPKTGPAGVRLVAVRMLRMAASSSLAAIPLTWLLLWAGTRYLGFPLPSDPWLLMIFGLTVALFGFQLVVADCFLGLHEVGLAPLFTGGLMAGPVTTLLFLTFALAISWTGGPGAGSEFTTTVAGLSIQLHKMSLLAGLSTMLVALLISLPIACWLLYSLLQRLPRAAEIERTEKETAENDSVRMIRVSLSLLGLAIAAYFLTVFVDVAIAGKVFGQGTVAFDLYSAARRLMFMAFITPQLAGSLVSPGVARLYYGDRRSELQSLLKKYGRYGAAPALVICAVLLIAPGELLGAYLGEKFAAAAVTTRWLAIAPLFAAWSGLGGYALAVTGYQRSLIVVNVVAGLFVLVAGFPAAIYGHDQGLALACVAGFVIKYAAEWILARRVLGVWTQIF